MVMIIIAVPLSPAQFWIVSELAAGMVADKREAWKEDFIKTTSELYQLYHVDDIQLFGPFSYIDGLAHQIQEALPYDDYSITVNVDDNASQAIPEGEFLTKQQNQDMLVEQIKKESGLIGLDGKPLSL